MPALEISEHGHVASNNSITLLLPSPTTSLVLLLRSVLACVTVWSHANVVSLKGMNYDSLPSILQPDQFFRKEDLPKNQPTSQSDA